MKSISIRVGSSYRLFFTGSVLNVKRTLVHKNYNEANTDYDFGLLELAKPLTFTNKIQPIALPSEVTEIEDKTLCQVSGWGKKNISFNSILFE